ncbi:MAG: outer membrane beta-barrel protein, partial [Bacteroidetes bacterium]|nr:outer membrane beta-barrel protein [Bacteroidota bacterium]
DISAEATTAASITKIDEQAKKVVGKSGKDSTIYTWKGKRIIIIDKDGNDTINIGTKHKHFRHRYSNEEFRHWAGFSMGVNGYVGSNGSITMQKATNYMDLDYGRSFNFQLNFVERHLNLYKHKVKLVTGFGLDYHSYAFNRKTNLNPNSDSLGSFASIDTTNFYTYTKNKFRTTYIQVPLLVEFNTSNNPNKTFHIAFGVIGQYLISSRTKQGLEQGDFEFTKQRKDSYNLNPFSAKAHVNLGYRGFTVFGEYNLTPMFQSGKGPELHAFSAGVRLIPFN